MLDFYIICRFCN